MAFQGKTIDSLRCLKVLDKKRRFPQVFEGLEQTSYPNIREGLESFRYFLMSGHTNVHKYVINLEFGIPIWEFIKSIGLNNTLYYNHEISDVKNLFHPSVSNHNHFTKIRLLRFLFNSTKKYGFREKFVSFSDILSNQLFFVKIPILLSVKIRGFGCVFCFFLFGSNFSFSR